MVLYLIYRNPKKLPAEEPKLSELSDHIVDVAKLSAICSEINTVAVPQLNDNGNNVGDQKIKEETEKTNLELDVVV